MAPAIGKCDAEHFRPGRDGPCQCQRLRQCGVGDIDQFHRGLVEVCMLHGLLDKRLAGQGQHDLRVPFLTGAHRFEQHDAGAFAGHQLHWRTGDSLPARFGLAQCPQAFGKTHEIHAKRFAAFGWGNVDQGKIGIAPFRGQQWSIRAGLAYRVIGRSLAPYPCFERDALFTAHVDRPVDAAQLLVLVQVAAGDYRKPVAFEAVAGAAQRAREGADETFMLGKFGLHDVPGLLRLEAKRLQLLGALPIDGQFVHGDHGASHQQRRHRDKQLAAAPQGAWLAADDPYQGRGQQHADGIAGPPADPGGNLLAFGNQAERSQGGDADRGADGAHDRGNQEKAQDVAPGVDGRMHPPAQMARADPRLQGRAKSRGAGGDGPACRRHARPDPGIRQMQQQGAQRYPGQDAPANDNSQGNADADGGE
jgi:hypothetical protein